MKKYIIAMFIVISSSLSAAIVVVPPGVDTIQPLVNSANPGDILELVPGQEYILTSSGGTIFLDKSLTIQGQGGISSGATVTTADSMIMFIIGTDNVKLFNFDIVLAADFPFVILTSPPTIPFIPLVNFTVDFVNITYPNQAIVLNKIQANITNNTFTTQRIGGATATAIVVNGTIIFASNISQNQIFSEASGVTTFLWMNDASQFENGILIEGNVLPTGQPPLDRFVFFENFINSLAPASFDFRANNNEFSALNGSFLFYSDRNLPADFFGHASSFIGNIDHSDLPNSYKGLVAFTGSGSGWDVATNPQSVFLFSGNTLATTSITEPNWGAVVGGGLFGIDLAVYNPVAANPIGNVQGFQYIEKFLTQGDYVNYLTWENLDPSTESFTIYKNSTTNLIATLPPLPTLNFYADHNQVPGRAVTYYIGAIVGGVESALVPITVP